MKLGGRQEIVRSMQPMAICGDVRVGTKSDMRIARRPTAIPVNFKIPVILESPATLLTESMSSSLSVISVDLYVKQETPG